MFMVPFVTTEQGPSMTTIDLKQICITSHFMRTFNWGRLNRIKENYRRADIARYLNRLKLD